MSIIKFKRTIRMSGRSAAVVIPPEIMTSLGWKIGDTVEIHVEANRVIIEKIPS